MKPGDIVAFIGCSTEQQRWGSNDPTDELILGRFYVIGGIEKHSWHTKLSLQGIEGRFNSVCFEPLENHDMVNL